MSEAREFYEKVGMFVAELGEVLAFMTEAGEVKRNYDFLQSEVTRLDGECLSLIERQKVREAEFDAADRDVGVKIKAAQAVRDAALAECSAQVTQARWEAEQAVQAAKDSIAPAVEKARGELVRLGGERDILLGQIAMFKADFAALKEKHGVPIHPESA